jgi:putative phosphoribosyl transferase
MLMHEFQDRPDAGRRLAKHLTQFAGQNVIVLALPRGGVPVGYEIARELNAPLDVFMVRKLGVPGREELAMGAIASGGIRVMNHSVCRILHIQRDAVDAVAVREQEELDRRERAYRGDRPPVDVKGRSVILVDDGLATGATMRAAIQAVSELNPSHIIVAVPTAPQDTVAELQPQVDEVICVAAPDPFIAVGHSYVDFRQTTDDEVRMLLQQAHDEYDSAHKDRR